MRDGEGPLQPFARPHQPGGSAATSARPSPPPLAAEPRGLCERSAPLPRGATPGRSRPHPPPRGNIPRPHPAAQGHLSAGLPPPGVAAPRSPQAAPVDPGRAGLLLLPEPASGAEPSRAEPPGARRRPLSPQQRRRRPRSGAAHGASLLRRAAALRWAAAAALRQT